MAYTALQIASMYSNVHAGAPSTPAQAALFDQLAQYSRTGQISDSQIQAYIINTADADTAVAVQAYQFFTGKSPTQAGIAYLVNSPSNQNDLNDPYYQTFSLENRYINFAQNLGLFGEGRTDFLANFNNLTFAQTVDQAYERIVGSTYAQVAGIDPAAAKADIVSRQGYFQQVANERFAGQNQDLAVKAAVIGYVMAEAIKADVGGYAAGVNNFLLDLIPDNIAQYNNDIVSNYATQSNGVSPQSRVIVLTPGFDFPGGAGAVVNTQGSPGEDIFIGTNLTLSNDPLNGGGGADRLFVTNQSTAVYTTTPVMTGVEQVEISATASGGSVNLDLVNSTGVTNVLLRGGLVGQGPNDIATGSVQLLNAPSGLTVIAEVDDTVPNSTFSFTVKGDATNDTLNLALRTTDTGGANTTEGLNTVTVGGVETLTITTQRASIANATVDTGDTLSIGALNAATTTKLLLMGDSAVSIGGGSLAALTSIDASTITKAVTLGSATAGLAVAAAGVEVTTGSGDDYVSLNLGSMPVLKAIDLKGGKDTLVLTGGAGAAVTVVDLSAIDQISQFQGVANAAVQTGIESIDLRGLGGAAQVTGTTAADTIWGTAGNDTITPGGGADMINVGSGFDTVVLATTGQTGAGLTADGALTGVEVITGLGAGDRISLSGLGLAAFNGVTAPEGTTYLSGATGAVALVQGSYTASTGAFVAGAGGADLLFEYDTNGGAAGGLEGVVLLGSNAAISSVSSDASGVFTFA